MKKSTLLSIALICLSTTSYATQPTGDGTVCNGSGSCGSTTTNNTTNQGGAGGVGYGGSASATGGTSIATGGNSSATGGASNVDVRNSSSNINANTVKNESTNIQGQQQQQAIKNSGNSSSTSSANNSGNNTGNSAASNSVTVQGDNFESARNPVNTAYAPPVAATANCALGVSGGVSFVGFSGSFGKAYVDENCAMLEKVRAVSQVLGDKATAEALLCLDPKYARARLNAGRACPVEQE